MQRFFRILSAMLLFAIGVWQILTHFNWFSLGDTLEVYFSRYLAPQNVWVVWVVAMFAPMALLCLTIKNALHKDILVLDTESGPALKIHQSAVASFLHDRLMQLPFIRHAKIEARSNHGTLNLRVRIGVRTTDQLDNLQGQVLKKILDDVRQSFGVSDVAEPDIQFDSLRAEKQRKRKIQEKEKPLLTKEKSESKPAENLMPYTPKPMVDDKPAEPSAFSANSNKEQSL